jgi:spore coat polysaccharide biosynthesis protein SpsF
LTEDIAPYGRQRVVGVIQARCGSTRLPAKALRLICGRPMILRLRDRLCLARQLDDVVLAIPNTAENDRLARVLSDVRFIRGPEEHLASRLLMATEGPEFGFPQADAIVRITGDEPLIDPAVVDLVVAAWREEPRRHYVSNVYPATARSWPEGVDVELMTRTLLEWLCRDSDPLAQASPSEWIWRHPDLVPYATVSHGNATSRLAHLHWSVDTAEDLTGANVVFSRLPEGFTTEEVLAEFGALSLPEIAKLHG